jgi:hypothetical protein
VIALARLAGFFAAHGIWSVSTGETLIPLVGLEKSDGTRELVRFASEDGVAQGKRLVAELREGRAAAVYDARITLPTGKTDALLVEARDGASGAAFLMAVPYRHASDARGFAVHRPKFLEIPAGTSAASIGEAFFAGVDAHTKAAECWNAHIDESI